MPERSVLVLLFWALAWVPAWSQESTVLPDPTRPYDRADLSAEPSAIQSYRLSGTLISPSGRVALFNGSLYREGDWVDGAQILAIEAGAVHIRTAADELTVYLGSEAARAQASAPAARSPPAQVSHETTPLQSTRARDGQVGAQPAQMLAPESFGTYARHAVFRGETLSEIARRYRSEDFSTNQMMIALFQANPEAFSGNINRLHEGAVLRIPDGDELHRQVPVPETATAEVARQHLDWRNNQPQSVRVADVPQRGSYGPVDSGETLSGIAEQVVRDGITMNQMMIALFEANPEAFSGNINRLHEGAVLRIPDGSALRAQPPEIATAEVMRQTDAWRVDSSQQARAIAERSRDGPEPGMYAESELRLAELGAESPPRSWPVEM